MWTWVIVSVISLGWSLFVGLWFHDWLVNTAKVDSSWAIIIEGSCSVVIGMITFLLLVPWLNEAFADAPDIVDVDPNSISISRALQAHYVPHLFGGIAMATYGVKKLVNYATKKTAAKTDSTNSAKQQKLLGKVEDLLKVKNNPTLANPQSLSVPSISLV